MERRDFLKIAGVAGAGGAAFGCSPKATERLIPYLVPEEEIVPGVATWFATTTDGPEALGVRVKVREGRPVFLEGNPLHPLSGGAVSALAQASLQQLYDPDRIKGPLVRSGPERFRRTTWDEGLRLFAERLDSARGGGVWFLGGHLTGSLDELVDRWLAALGSGNRVRYEPFGYEAALAANRLVFGREEMPLYDIGRAGFVISFGADFLETWLAPTFFARGFTAMHAFRNGRMGKYVHVEPRMSMGAANADEWIAPRPGTEMLVALGMAHALAGAGGGTAGVSLGAYAPEATAERTGVPAETVRRLAREFADRGPGLALGGGVANAHRNATATWVAANVLNRLGGAEGRTLRFGPTFRTPAADGARRVAELVDRMRAGEVRVLVVHDANPVFALPPAAGFAEALGNVPFKVGLSTFYDETAAHADLLLPASHWLESWGDAEPLDGVRGLRQPVLPPLHDTRPVGDVLLATARAAGAADLAEEDFGAFLRGRWSGSPARGPLAGQADAGWFEALARGGSFGDPGALVVGPGRSWSDAGAGSAAAAGGADPTNGANAGRPAGPGNRDRAAASTANGNGAGDPETAPAAGGGATDAGGAAGAAVTASPGPVRFEPAAFDGDEDGLHLMAVPSIGLHDGRGANAPWMQELPDPVTKAVWGSWIEIHPDTARRLGVRGGDLLEVASPHGRVKASAFLYPGIRPDTVAMPIGQGHTEYGRYAKRRGANPVALLPAELDAASGGRVWFATRVTLSRASADDGWDHRLIEMQGSPHQHSRGIALAYSAAEAAEAEAAPAESESVRLLERITADADEDSPYRWGMTIDLAKCVGCSACVTACYAENNIPAVGPDDCVKGRELSWLRIERYWAEPDEVEETGEFSVRWLPMLCQHCGQAPCEPVCPVYAAYHNPEGLNAQIYNRCVGTRYCANNCPYKVRKFNFFDHSNRDPVLHAHPMPETLQLLYNPSVTVRSKGVMEKCTFCVQRIREAKIAAKGQGRAVRDGEVVTACQAACPTEAIVFGNLREPQARVTREAQAGRGYSVLASLNTRSAITYLADVVATDRPLRGAAGHGERGPSHGPMTEERERRGGKRGAETGAEDAPAAPGAH
ncbi:MAG TPA: molybdopterin dinucleotide binding domain-containing protein [Gemmatimonadota bacterium]|jgi:molybdopterin-containing oxidoreductase family iron-sulfur binding subunit